MVKVLWRKKDRGWCSTKTGHKPITSPNLIANLDLLSDRWTAHWSAPVHNAIMNWNRKLTSSGPATVSDGLKAQNILLMCLSSSLIHLFSPVLKRRNSSSHGRIWQHHSWQLYCELTHPHVTRFLCADNMVDLPGPWPCPEPSLFYAIGWHALPCGMVLHMFLCRTLGSSPPKNTITGGSLFLLPGGKLFQPTNPPWPITK